MSHLRLQERFRQEFLDQLPHKLQHAAQFLDALPHHASPQAPLAELFLIIHSIRGSSATFGLPWLTVICHPFEELIQSAIDTRLQVSLFVTLAHNYLALLHHTAQTLAEGRSPGDDIPKQLAKLHRQAFALCFTVAVVVNSRTLREMCLQALQPFDARVVEFDDPLNALQRILTEPFHAMIVSSELYPMRGEALIASIHYSCRARRASFKTVLLSSNGNAPSWKRRDCDPDFVILRNQQFLLQLHATLGLLYKQIKHSAEIAA